MEEVAVRADRQALEQPYNTLAETESPVETQSHCRGWLALTSQLIRCSQNFRLGSERARGPREKMDERGSDRCRYSYGASVAVDVDEERRKDEHVIRVRTPRSLRIVITRTEKLVLLYLISLRSP